MLRAEGYHILSLVLACVGTASGVEATHRAKRPIASAVLLASAAGFTIAGIRRDRRSIRTPTADARPATIALHTRVRELEARLKAASLEADVARSAVAHLSNDIVPLVSAAIDQPDNASQLKENLVRHLSHELRTPLTSIQACSELLLEGEPVDGPTRRDLFGIIHAESQRLAMVIDSALSLTRLKSGLIPIQKTRMFLGALAVSTLQDLQPLATQRNVSVELKPAEFEDAVLADQELLGHALRIMLCNAIQQTPSGRRVVVCTQRIPASHAVALRVCFQHWVNPPKDLSDPFDKFYGGAEKDDDGFVSRGSGFDLARRVIETVHAGRTFISECDGVRALGFELPAMAQSDVLMTIPGPIAAKEVSDV